jgi:hypothetical protein
MGKRAATRDRTSGGATSSGGAPHPRQPCPCGSGKRYKACHGAAGGSGDVIVTRPFEGLAAEGELVALREFVPSATAPLPLVDQGARSVVLATVLPMAAAAIVREEDGRPVGMVGMQVQTRSGDLSRDLARAVQWALTAEPGGMLAVVGPDDGTDTTRLQDLLRTDEQLEVTLHKDFSWWVPPGEEPSNEIALSLERANTAIMPTERITAPGVEAAYWVDARGKAHVRWVRPEPEEQLLAALARLSAADALAFGEGSRYVGSFRAHGLLVPVWDVDPEMHATEWAEPAAAFAARLSEALASDAPLTDAERRALQGLRGRQLTLR